MNEAKNTTSPTQEAWPSWDPFSKPMGYIPNSLFVTLCPQTLTEVKAGGVGLTMMAAHFSFLFPARTWGGGERGSMGEEAQWENELLSL